MAEESPLAPLYLPHACTFQSSHFPFKYSNVMSSHFIASHPAL